MKRLMPHLPAGMLLLALLAPASAFADYTVTGRFRYQDREFDINGYTGTITPRPIRFADVIIRAGGGEIARGATSEDGSFTISVNSSAAQLITAYCVTSTSATPYILFDLTAAANDSYALNGDLYSVASIPQTATGKNPVDFGTTLATADTDVGKAFNIWDVVIDSLQFLSSSNAAGGFPPRKLTVSWSSSQNRTGSFFSFDGTNRAVYVGVLAYSDDTVIAHEVGHFMDNLYSKSDSPGGTHYLGQDTQDIRLSWGEGLATFLGCSSRKFQGRSSPEIYVSTDGKNLNFGYELERLSGGANITSKTGSTNEVAVSATLWDIIDTDDDYPTGNGDGDPLYRPFHDVWRVLTEYLPTVTRPGISIETFWLGWLNIFKPVGSGLKDLQDTFAGVINGVDTGINGIEFRQDAQEPDDAPAQAPLISLPQRPSLAAGPKVVISELDLGDTDQVELYNAGDFEADLSGWTVEASAPPYATVTLTLPSFRLPAGSFVVLSEASGLNTASNLYFNKNISWANGKDGACSLKDSKGGGVDFVRWGNSSEPVPGGTAFNGPNPASPPTGRNLARKFSEADSDSGSDWTAQTSSLGTYNLSGEEEHHTYYSIGDVDYVAFSAVAGRHYLSETFHLFDGADTVLDLIAADGVTVLATADDFGQSKASRLVWTAPANGKFYVRSRRFDGASNYAQFGSYDLRIMESTLPFTLDLPKILTVSQPGQGGKFQSISDAIYAAANGDTVQILDNGSYAEAVTIAGKSLSLKAAAGKNPVIDGRNLRATLALNISYAKTVAIDGITILAGQRGMRIGGGSVTMVNSVVAGASDPAGYADGIQVSGPGSSANIVNCTIVGNARLGVGVFSGASARISNSILYGNQTDISSDSSAITLTVRNSLVGTGGYGGSNGNISGNPQFVDAANNNYRLKSASPAIDAGDPADPNLPPTDADGLPRSIDGRGTGQAKPDMGAFEYLPPGALTSLAVIPQVAAGGNPAYRTSIVAVNTGAVAAWANLSLARSDGSPFPVTILNDPANLPSPGYYDASTSDASAGRFASTFNLSIPPGGTARYEASAPGDLVAGYAALSSSSQIAGAALFETVANGIILSEAGVGLSGAATGFVVYIDNVKSANSGYAVANYGSAPADLFLTLRDAGGRQKDAASIRLEPGRHLSEFAFQRFPASATVGADFEGSIEFSSSRPVAAVALRYDNPAQDVFSTIPVLVDEASTTLHFPQVADGGSYRTDFILLNPTDAQASARLEFFKDDGTPLGLPVGGLKQTGLDIQIPAKGVVHLTSDGASPSVTAGWARVTSSAAIGGSAVFQTVSGGRILSEAGVAASPLSLHSTAYVSTLGGTESGIALCNPGNTELTVTLNLRDTSGQIAASITQTLGPLGHVAKFLTQWFPAGFSEFEGTLEMVSTGPVSAVALRYDQGLYDVFATLPVITIP